MNLTENSSGLNQIGAPIGSEQAEVSQELEKALLEDDTLYQEHDESPGEKMALNPDELPCSTAKGWSDSRPPTGDNFRLADERMETDTSITPTAYIKPHSAAMMTSQEQLVPLFRDGFKLLAAINEANDRETTELLPRKSMQSIRSILHCVTKQISQLTTDITVTPHPTTQPRNRSSMCRQCTNPWPCNNTSCSSWVHAEKVKKEKAERRAAAKERAAETKKSPTHTGFKWLPVDEQGNVIGSAKPAARLQPHA